MSCRSSLPWLTGLALLFVVCPHVPGQTTKSSSDDDSVAEKVAAATKHLQQQQVYDLRYKLKKGESIRWKVTQNAATKMQMAGYLEESSSRIESVKLWKVSNVDSRGNMTFVHSLESVSAWNKVGDEEPIAFNSADEEAEIPEGYQGTADQIGKPLAVFTVSANGEIVDRKSSLDSSSFGVGKVTVPLPAESIRIGHRWAIPTIFTANDEEGRTRKVKARIVYELVKVSGNNAYIKFRTELLTPSVSEKVKSTIMQKTTDGYVVFDIDRGRPIKKQIEWDEKAQGFEGADSSLTYIAKMVEVLLEDEQPVNTKKATEPKSTDTSKVRIRTRESEAISRR